MRILTQETLTKPLASQTLLTLNMPNIDALFPGFAAGDFAVLHGAPGILQLSLLLCVRAQLPSQLGGLGTNVVFVDGGNTFRLYQVSRIAQLHSLDPRQVLNRIYISRAFTAYQIASIVFEKLGEIVDRFNAKLAVISDIAGLFLDKDVPAEEARKVFSRLALHLSRLAEEKQLTILATYSPHYYSRRNTFLQALVCARANTVMFVRSTRHGQELVLEKHLRFKLGRAEFPSNNLTLADFMENMEHGKNC